MSLKKLPRGVAAFYFLLFGFSANSTFVKDPYLEHMPLKHDVHNEDSPPEIFPLFNLPRAKPAPLPLIPTTASKERAWRELRREILGDFQNRLNSDFVVPEGLRERTEFWFDIYTKYGEAHHVIHHVRYPHIVFKVVDTTELLTTGKGPTWLRRDRAQKFARKQADEVRKALKRLARRSSYRKLSPLEKELFDKLASLPGSRKSVIRMASKNVRSQLGQRDFFKNGLANSSRYLPYMEEEFKKRGLPIELTRMPFVESSFNEDAYSKVGASGIWQIMPRTGKAYMIVNDHIDERNSPLKATATAARLLRSYHKALGSWPLAITSYNHGIGNIKKAIKAAKSRDLATIIARYHRGDFRFASSNFFTCFLAATYAERYSDLIFKDVPRKPVQEHEVIQLVGRTRAKYLSRVTGLAHDELLKFNLDIRAALKRNTFLPKGFKLHLPLGYASRLPGQNRRQEARNSSGK